MKLIKKLRKIIDKHGYKRWISLFYCEYCKKEVEKEHCRGLKYKSCGCARKLLLSKYHIIHGDNKRINGKKNATELYAKWHSMKARCYNEKNKKYHRYGGRGIKICDKWLNSYIDFKNWALENGYVKGLSIDRIDNNGDYEPSNCQFIIMAENCRKTNKTVCNMDIAKKIRSLNDNVNITCALLGKIFGLSKHVIYNVIHNRSWKLINQEKEKI